MTRIYDSSEALQAAWELANQGYLNPTIVLRTNHLKGGVKEIWLFCSPKEDDAYPDIDIDDVASWATPNGRIPRIAGVCDDSDYWWIFD